jgi:hypothetical protein
MLGAFGPSDEAVKALSQAFFSAIGSKNWVYAVLATESLAQMGEAPARLMDRLSRVLDEADPLVVRGNSHVVGHLILSQLSLASKGVYKRLSNFGCRRDCP